LVPSDWGVTGPVFDDAEPSDLLILFRHVDGTRGAVLDGALAHLLDQIRSWAPAFVERHFSGRAPDVDDLADDGVQRLVLAVSARELDLTVFAADASVMAWCQAVLTNYVLSEVRTRRRSSRLPPYSHDLVSHTIDERNTFEVFVRLLREQVRGSTRPGQSH